MEICFIIYECNLFNFPINNLLLITESVRKSFAGFETATWVLSDGSIISVVDGGGQ